MDLQEKLHQGIAAAKAGQKSKARALLLAVVEADEQQLSAWLWLSRVVDSVKDKEICFENILVLDPDNQYGQKGVAWVKKKEAEAAGSEAPVAVANPKTGDQGQGRGAAQDVMSRAEAIASGYLVEDEFDNIWLCPYCAVLTTPENIACPNCCRPLIRRERLSPGRSVWLWRGFFLQVYTAFYILATGLIYFTVVTKFRGVPNPLLLLPLYLGLPVDQPPEYIELALATLPRSIFWLLIGAALYSLSLMLILYFRIPFGHLMYVINVGFMIMFGILGLVFGDWWLIQTLAGLGLVLALGQLVITVNLWSDFSFKETRLTLKLDREATNHTALYESARNYSNLQMWGNTALHLRRAVGIRPEEVAYHLALTVAYINLKRADLAQKSLAEAERLNPQASEIQRLRQRLAAIVPDRIED